MPAPDLSLFQPPEKPLSFVGSLRRIAENPLACLPRSLYEEGLGSLAPLGRPWWFVMDPVLVKEVLIDRADDFTKSELQHRLISPLMGETSVFTAEGHLWRWQRRAAAPAFRNEALLGMLPSMERVASGHAVDLAAKAGETVDVAELMLQVTFQVMATTMLSNVESDRLAHAREAYLDAMPMVALWAVLNLPSWLPHPGQGRLRRGVASIRDEVMGVIAAARARAEPKGDLLDMLIAARDPETGDGLSDELLRDNIIAFVAAGHETTATMLTWTVWLLDRHPEWRERVEAEIDSVLGDGPMTAEHFAALDVTKRVSLEAMRLFPTVNFMMREARVETTLRGERVRAGAPVLVPTFVVHRHTKLWDQPALFDPDRFLPEAVKARHRCAYLPYGLGPRTCIGAGLATIEMATVLATLLRRVRFRAISDEVPKVAFKLIMRPDGAVPMRVEARSTARAAFDPARRTWQSSAPAAGD